MYSWSVGRAELWWGSPNAVAPEHAQCPSVEEADFSQMAEAAGVFAGCPAVTGFCAHACVQVDIKASLSMTVAAGFMGARELRFAALNGLHVELPRLVDDMFVYNVYDMGAVAAAAGNPVAALVSSFVLRTALRAPAVLPVAAAAQLSGLSQARGCTVAVVVCCPCAWGGGRGCALFV